MAGEDRESAEKGEVQINLHGQGTDIPEEFLRYVCFLDTPLLLCYDYPG